MEERFYKLALDIISHDDIDWKKLCVEVAKENPEVLVKSSHNIIDIWKKEAYRLYVKEGQKIQAIKYCREQTGMSLKDAKEAVEVLA